MDAPDGLIREAGPIELGAGQTSALFQICVELLDVPGGQLVQRDSAQGGDDVLIDPPLVGHLGVGPEICLLVLLIPAVQPGAQRDPRPGRLGSRRLQALPQLLQLGGALRFRPGQDVFGDGKAPLVPSHHEPALPAAVLSQADAAVAAFSAPCHGFISSPR